jgi:carboxylesterase type B
VLLPDTVQHGRERNKASPFIGAISKLTPSIHSCDSSSDTLSCVRAADINTLQNLNSNINLDGFYGMLTFVPVVDGTFIVERPTVTLSKGRLNGVSLTKEATSEQHSYASFRITFLR